MDIKVTYEPTAKELAKASSLFIEKKPFLMVIVFFMNAVAVLLVAIMLLKLVMLGLSEKEWLALVGGILWILGRRPANEWVLLQRMKRSRILDKSITVEMSANGIIWAGKGLAKGRMSWPDLKYVMVAKNGWLIPHNSMRFLWLPFRAFKPGDIDILQKFLLDKEIEFRDYPKWEC